ncbi:MAG: acyl-CoA synthetase, partial [uncultured bacterium]
MDAAASHGTTVHQYMEYFVRQDPDALCCSLRVKGAWADYSRLEFWDHVCRYATLFLDLEHQSVILFAKKLDIHLLTAYIGAMKAGHLPAQ